MLKFVVSIATALILAASPLGVHAQQSGCAAIVYGAVLTAAQWNNCFMQKQDALTFTPVNRAGDSMQGRLSTFASSASRAGLAILPGTAPSSPTDGDVWMTSLGLYARVNGSTVGPLSAAAAAALSAANDTNVTATLSGSPSIALLQPVTLTLGWTGSLSITRGGTGANLRAAAISNLMPVPTRAGDVAYWDGSAWQSLAGNNTSTRVLQETSAGVPSWTAAGTGTVTSVASGTGLTGGPVTGSGTLSVSLTNLTNSIGSNVLLNNTATYFDGPSVAQGTSGTWYASGSVVVSSPTGDGIICKLWDGTTVMDIGVFNITAGANATIALSGVLASPAANIRISCKDTSTTSGTMTAAADSVTKASTVTTFRIQ